MILVDSNILIDYFRSRDSDLAAKIDTLDIAVCGPVKTEVLHGALNDDEIDKIIKSYTAFNLKVIDEYDWEFTGFMLNTLRKNGFQLPLNDVLIAYIAIKYDIPVWTRDNHFRLIQSLYPELKIYSEVLQSSC